MRYSKPQIITALTTIIKIQERIIKANAASAGIYKTELKALKKLWNRCFKNWLNEIDVSAGLRRDKQNVWDERNKAVYDYNALYGLCKLQHVTGLPEYEEYELPNGDPVSDYVLDIEGRLMESGRIRPIAHLIKIPTTDPEWHTKFRNKSYSFQDLIKRKKKSKKKHDRKK